ncbi:MAG: hypothetical protein ACRCRP_02850 [Metamycoplasmataceae bacterium]
MKKLKNKMNFLLFSSIALTTGAVLTVVSCTSQNVIKDEKQLNIKKKVDSIELNQNELNILKPKNNVITEQVKLILDKMFDGIDSTNIKMILFYLDENQNKISISPIEGYYFGEEKLTTLDVKYTIQKEIVNISVSVKEIKDKIENKDIENILGKDNTKKVSSLSKLFNGIDDKNVLSLNTERIDNTDKTAAIKLNANSGYIFNNTEQSITSNPFSISTPEVVPPPIIPDPPPVIPPDPPPTVTVKLNITAKKAVVGGPMTEPELRAIRHGATPIEDKIKYLNKLFDGIDKETIKHIQTFDYTGFTQVNLTTKQGYVFANGTNKLDSITFPRAPKVTISITAKSTEVDFSDQDVEDMKSQDKVIKLRTLNKIFNGLTLDNINGVVDPAVNNGGDAVIAFSGSGYVFDNNKTRIESGKLKGISKKVLIKSVEYPSGVFKEDFTSLKDPQIPDKYKIKILTKFFTPSLEDDRQFNFIEIKNINTTTNKITIKTKQGYIFIPQTHDGKNVYEITSGPVTNFAPSPKFLGIDLVPDTKSITKQDITDFNNPSKKLSVLKKYFKNIDASNINNISTSINQYKTAISIKANNGYSLGKYTQIDSLDSWWNLPAKEINSTTGPNPVHQWMPRQQDEYEAGPLKNKERLNDYPFKWLSSSPTNPTQFPTLNADEQKIVDFYKNTTARITVPAINPDDPDGEYEESGTVWYYPRPATETDDTWTYFATNIHVIRSLITKNPPITSNQTPVHGFYLKDDDRHRYARINFSRDKQASVNDRGFVYSMDIAANEMQLVDLALDRSSNYDINGKNRNMLDFAVFRVKTVGQDIFNKPFDIKQHVNKNNDINKYDWIDTEAEFKEVFENIQDLTFYVGGYPGGFWTIKSYTRNQYWVPQTSTLPIMGGTQWYTDASLSAGNAVKLDGEEWYSMSNNILLPNLVIGGGGSGSLVTILHKGVVRPVAILWGTFAQKNLNELNFVDLTGADLFYTPNFYFKDRKTGAPGYDFTKLKKS